MEKHTWNKVHCNLKSSSHPSSRWGHSCCQAGDLIVYFGGYAGNSINYNRFNIHERYLDIQHFNDGLDLNRNIR